MRFWTCDDLVKADPENCKTEDFLPELREYWPSPVPGNPPSDLIVVPISEDRLRGFDLPIDDPKSKKDGVPWR